MESFLLTPFKVARKRIGLVFAPAIPVLFLMAYFVMVSGVSEPVALLEQTDSYLGGTMYLSAANLTAFNELSTNVQIPIIRLGGIAEMSDIHELNSPFSANFILVFTVLFLGFISYAIVARSVSSLIKNEKKGGLLGINPGTIILSAVAAFLMIFITSFSLGGFKLLLMISFGLYFTFSIPYAAAGDPLGESIFKGFKFLSRNPGRIVASYIGCMGAAIMIPIGLLIFTTPLILNLESVTVTTLLKLFLGLLSLILALFYQMALCAVAVFGKKDDLGV